MILAIDTSAGQCAVALLDGGRSAVDVVEMTRGHAEALFPMIDGVLAQVGAKYKDLSRIAVCTGPGSFTGLRAGIAAARGLALGCNIPAVGITRFEAIAAVQNSACIVRLPGRGETVYAQDFDAIGNPLTEPRIETGSVPEELADPMQIARLGLTASDVPRPAPLYLRDADAALPKVGPPPLLD